MKILLPSFTFDDTGWEQWQKWLAARGIRSTVHWPRAPGTEDSRLHFVFRGVRLYFRADMLDWNDGRPRHGVMSGQISIVVGQDDALLAEAGIVRSEFGDPVPRNSRDLFVIIWAMEETTSTPT